MEKNFTYDNLFEQYQSENPCWDEFVSDSFYYELMDWYDSKNNFDDDQGHSEDARNFAKYVWDMYIMGIGFDEENRDMHGNPDKKYKNGQDVIDNMPVDTTPGSMLRKLRTFLECATEEEKNAAYNCVMEKCAPMYSELEKSIKTYVKNISLANSKGIQEMQLAECARHFITLCKENLTIYLLEKFDQEISSAEERLKESSEGKYASHVKPYDEGFLHAMICARDIIFKNNPVFYSGNTETEQQIADAIEMSEPLEIVHNGKIYKVHGTFVTSRDVKYFKIEKEPNFYIWVCNPEDVYGLNK